MPKVKAQFIFFMMFTIISSSSHGKPLPHTEVLRERLRNNTIQLNSEDHRDWKKPLHEAAAYGVVFTLTGCVTVCQWIHCTTTANAKSVHESGKWLYYGALSLMSGAIAIRNGTIALTNYLHQDDSDAINSDNEG